MGKDGWEGGIGYELRAQEGKWLEGWGRGRERRREDGRVGIKEGRMDGRTGIPEEWEDE